MIHWTTKNQVKSDSEEIAPTTEENEIEELRNKSLGFVRNLLPIADSSGKTINPIDDEQVPAMFERIIEGLEKSIKK